MDSHTIRNPDGSVMPELTPRERGDPGVRREWHDER